MPTRGAPLPRSSTVAVRRLAVAALALAACAAPADDGGRPRELPSVAEAAGDTVRHEGLLPVHVDADAGRVLLELPAPAGPDGEVAAMLLLDGLRTGVGHNDLGLDRGRMGEARVVTWRRLGPRVLLEEPNLGFRADSGDAAARRATRESFATSVLWAGEVAGLDDDGTALVDVTDLLLEDTHGVAATLRRSGQGAFRRDADRSLVDTAACLAFPDNLEFEAVLTFAADDPGGLVAAVTPTADSVTVVQHLSLVRLPDDGYVPRTHDPRAGAFSVTWQDTTAPLSGPTTRSWSTRHRLVPVDPGATPSPVVEPVVYHVDRGAPEAVRDALVEGAGWWSDAFEAAGYEDAFRVELLPEGAHPLDVRYNVVQWVHRSTRGWSYGNSIVDPRTGEIVKGHVTLGSLRVRQDRLLFEGLLGTGHTGDGGPLDPVELALSRIRQLAAHEVGHTLGFAHNFAASRVPNGSVMDYPAPLVRVAEDGELDVSRAYGTGVGAWDRRALSWLYTRATPGSEEEARLRDEVGAAQALIPFLSDGDARPPGAAHPGAHLWDNGADPVAELAEVLAVRAHALERFGVDRVADGRPLAELEEVLATVYFHHRYQVDAVVKSVGGVDYRHAIRDGEPHVVRPVDGDVQRAALAALLGVLAPEVLDVPEAVLELLHPRPPGRGRDREQFATRTAPTFDALSAAGAAAEQVVAALLRHERVGRLVDQHRRDPSLPGAREVLDALVEATVGGAGSGPPGPPTERRFRPIRETVDGVVVDGLVRLATDPRASDPARRVAEDVLRDLYGRLEGMPWSAGLRARIGRFLERPAEPAAPPSGAPEPPPGSPIGLPAPADGCTTRA